MPINLEKLAYTTGFQNNCGLNALTHLIVRNLDRLPAESKEMLHGRFLKYYDVNERELPQEEMVNLLKKIGVPNSDDFNPIRLEAFCGPVLRSYLHELHPERGLNELVEDGQVAEIANKFNIKVESYTKLNVSQNPLANNLDQLANIEQEYIYGNNAPVDTLKLCHTGASHFEYEEIYPVVVQKHNEHYKKAVNSNLAYGTAANLESLRQKIRANFKKLKFQQNVIRTFDEFETRFKDDAFKSMFAIFNQAKNKMDALFPESNIGKVLTIFFQAIAGILMPLLQMIKVLAQSFGVETQSANAANSDVESPASVGPALVARMDAAHAAQAAGSVASQDNAQPANSRPFVPAFVVAAGQQQPAQAAELGAPDNDNGSGAPPPSYSQGDGPRAQ